MEKYSVRQSNLELLRILCMFGIVVMHILGPLRNNMSFINGQIDLMLNSIFNSCVTIFILISGYFGIKLNHKKMIKLWCMVMFYSILTFTLETISTEFNLKSFIKACIPIISNKYWFITAYFILCYLAPYINKMIEKFDKKTNRNLIITMLIIFSIIPTIFQFEVTKDNGKGIINMLLIYLIGRYIRNTNLDINRKKVFCIGVVSIIITYVFMAGISFIKNNITLGYFFRDNSIFMIVTAICIFMIFKSFDIKSNLINVIAKHTLSIYVFESALRTYILNYIIDLNMYTQKSYFYIIILIFTIITMTICVVVEAIRSNTLGKLEDLLINKGMEIKKQ